VRAPPVFIATNARSGSTLLRWLIDAHVDVACPGETDVADLLRAYVQSAIALDPQAAAGDQAARQGAQVVDNLMATHLQTIGKRYWCDKSLSNVVNLELLAAAWPDARFVLLHRQCMDVIASALEASEWGLDTYGLAPYAQMSPNNPMVAVAGYWIERTATMVEFERRHPERCLRLRYEDLVTRTDASMGAVWDLFGVAPAKGGAGAAFGSPHDPLAPADYKIWHTDAVHADSVGRGARMPQERLGPTVRDAVNVLQAELGYDAVDDQWGSGGLAISAGAGGANGAVELRVVDGHSVLARAVVDGFFPVDSGASDDPVSCVVVIERSSLDSICSGGENIGRALKRRTVRRYGEIPTRFGGEKQFVDGLAAFLSSSGWGLLAYAGPMEAAAPTPRRSRVVARH
jgi:hypothetical protein